MKTIKLVLITLIISIASQKSFAASAEGFSKCLAKYSSFLTKGNLKAIYMASVETGATVRTVQLVDQNTNTIAEYNWNCSQNQNIYTCGNQDKKLEVDLSSAQDADYTTADALVNLFYALGGGSSDRPQQLFNARYTVHGDYSDKVIKFVCSSDARK